MRELRAERALTQNAQGLARAFRRDDPATWLPDLTRAGDRPDRWLVYLWGGQVGVLVDLTVGVALDDGDVVSRSVSWEAVRWLGLRTPAFTGELSLVHGPQDRATLVLRGTYRPPGGLPGVLADRIVLHRLARTTANQLLADIAERLDRPERVGRSPS